MTKICDLSIITRLPLQCVYIGVHTLLMTTRVIDIVTHLPQCRIYAPLNCSTLSHYMNQCWLVVNWTLWNQFLWNSYQNTKLFIHENTFHNAVCEIVAILSSVYSIKCAWVPGIKRAVYYRKQASQKNSLNHIFFPTIPNVIPLKTYVVISSPCYSVSKTQMALNAVFFHLYHYSDIPDLNRFEVNLIGSKTQNRVHVARSSWRNQDEYIFNDDRDSEIRFVYYFLYRPLVEGFRTLRSSSGYSACYTCSLQWRHITVIASQVTDNCTVVSSVRSDVHQWKHQSFLLLVLYLSVTGGFPSQRVRNPVNPSLSWCHHVMVNFVLFIYCGEGIYKIKGVFVSILSGVLYMYIFASMRWSTHSCARYMYISMVPHV